MVESQQPPASLSKISGTAAPSGHSGSLQWNIVKLLGPNSLRSAGTARTYPAQAEKLARVIEEAVRELPRWSLAGSTGTEIRASRGTRLGFKDNVTIRLTPSPSGAHTNTHVALHSASRVAVWDLGQNERNLKELLAIVDRKLTADS
jgi:hypothetical protein